MPDAKDVLNLHPDSGDRMSEFAIEATRLVKRFGDRAAVDGVDLVVPAGAIYGILGPNGAGKTTLIRTLLGIVEPDAGSRRLFGHERPLDAAHLVGYLPEERGLYQSMKARDVIAFIGALRGQPLAKGRARADELLAAAGLGDYGKRAIRTLSKGQAQTVQLLGTIVHAPKLVVLDEPFSGLDAINQGRLEALIRDERNRGATILFSTHVIAHAERLCERIAIIAGGRVRFEGSVDAARGRLRPTVRLATRNADGAWRTALPADATHDGAVWRFDLPMEGIEPLLSAIIADGAGITDLAIERPSLHDAFVAIAGADAAEPQPEMAS